MFDLRDNNTVNVYIDDGYTAKNLNRPGMKKILDKVSNNQIKAIYIYKLDRLSRSVTDIYNMLTFFLDHNCDLNAIADNINIQSANGRLFIGILAIIAQWESEVISERTLNAIQEMVNQGNYPLGTVIFGYERHQKKLRFLDKEHRTVLKIYELLSLGYVIKSVERYLADDEELCSLSAKTIKRIATDRRYLGEFEYKGVMYYNIVPQMIDQKLFDLVQTGVSKRLKHQDNTKYYFGNKVMANNEILIHEMTKKKNRNYYYYRSTSTRKRINQDILIEQILYKLLLHANIVERESLIKINTKKIRALDLKIKKLYDKYRLSKLDEKDYIIALTRLEMEKAPLLNEVKILYKKDYSKWYSYTDEERSAFISAYVKRVHVDLDLNFVIDIEYK